MLQELLFVDCKTSGLAFCVELGRMHNDLGHLGFMLFSDKAVFLLTGNFNDKYTRCYWPKTNPDFFTTRPVKSKGLDV